MHILRGISAKIIRKNIIFFVNSIFTLIHMTINSQNLIELMGECVNIPN